MATQNAINNSVKITSYTANDTWTKDSRTQYVQIYIRAGGNGGGSGRRGVSGASGGGGGGCSQGFLFIQGPAASLSTTQAIVVGAGGAGGAAQTVDNSNGNDGSVGGSSGFGDIVLPVNTVAGGGGTTTNSLQNNPVTINTIGSPSSSGSQAGTGLNTNGSDRPDGSAVNGSVGSGTGGGGASTTTEYRGGNAGGYVNFTLTGTVLLAGGTGGTESGTIDGGNGNTSVGLDWPVPLSGTGGGGGGGQHVGAAAGNGGDGAIPGGAGGGGGGSLNGTNSGAGGDGARGEVIVIEYF